MRFALIALLFAWAAPAVAGPKCPSHLPQDKLNDCWVAAAAETEVRLEQLMRDLKRSLSSRNWARMRESHDLWAHSRDIDCKVEASLIEGPAREAVRYGCTEKRALERIHQLRYYLCPRYNVTGQCDAVALYP